MASQDARLSKFEADFKQQQNEMTNKIDTVLKAITDRIAGALPSDTVKNPKLRLGRDMHVFVGNMSYVMDFTILESIATNIDPSLSNVVFGRPFVEMACLAINRKYRLMTFTDGIKEITFKTPYKDPERSELSSEGHDLLSSRVILSEDDYDRGCRKPSDLEDGFYRDTIKLGPEYVTGMDDE
ncbi:hypothetical protein Tco_1115693 [Tanacetum coccineum]